MSTSRLCVAQGSFLPVAISLSALQLGYFERLLCYQAHVGHDETRLDIPQAIQLSVLYTDTYIYMMPNVLMSFYPPTALDFPLSVNTSIDLFLLQAWADKLLRQ